MPSKDIPSSYSVTPKIQIKTKDNILIKEFTNLVFDSYSSTSFSNVNSPFFFVIKTTTEGLIKLTYPEVVHLPGNGSLYKWNNPNTGDSGSFVFVQNLPEPKEED